MSWLNSYFDIKGRNSTISREVVAGISTFLAIVYIVVVNPAILSQAGFDQGAVFVATILSTVFATALIGIWGNWPIALAPGLGLNAFVAFEIVLGSGYSPETALGAIFVSGVLFLIIALTGLRKAFVNSIPDSLKVGIGSGIGFFILLIGLVNAGIVVANDATIIGFGDITETSVVLALVGLFIMLVLGSRNVIGSAIISVGAVTILGYFFGLVTFNGVVSSIPSIEPSFLKLDILGALTTGGIGLILILLFVDFFDSTGTLLGLGRFLRKSTNNSLVLEDSKPAYASDALGTIVGSMLGTSNVSTYIESSIGIREGGRTGLTAVVVALLLLVTLFFFPIVSAIPIFAIAPVLIFAGLIMSGLLGDLSFKDPTDFVPAILGALIIPFTFSIANGISVSFIVYVIMKVAKGEAKKVRALNYVVAVLGVIFILYV